MGIVAPSRADKRSNKAKAGPTISDIAATVGVITLVLLGFSGTTQAQPPHINIAQTCRSSANAMIKLMGGSTEYNYLEQCLESEQKAREQIVKDWVTFSAADKAQCLQTRVYLPNYVEWQTCLETARDVRKLRGKQPAPGPA